MNYTRFLTIALIAVLVAMAFMLFCAGKAEASPLQYSGSLELRSPVWASRDVTVFVPDDYYNTGSTAHFRPGVFRDHRFTPRFSFLDLAGNIRFFREGSPLAFWVSGEHSFSRGYFVRENELKVGIDCKVGRGPLTLFSYWDHRPDFDVDRVFVGARVGFQGVVD